jgi:hypothetical protein
MNDDDNEGHIGAHIFDVTVYVSNLGAYQPNPVLTDVGSNNAVACGTKVSTAATQYIQVG